MLQECLGFEVLVESGKIWGGSKPGSGAHGVLQAWVVRAGRDHSLENTRSKITYLILLWHCMCVR